jgi:ATP-binding cassette subfamily F protein 3
MRQALAVALQEFEGALVLVSHDRHLLNTVADEFRLVADGRALPFDGDLEDYARWLATAPATAAATAPAVDTEAAPTAAPPPPTAAMRAPAGQRKQRKRAEAERRAALSPLRAAIAEHERQLEKLTLERTRLDRELLAASTDADAVRLSTLMKDQARLAKSIASVEAAWLQASEQLEALKA